MNDRNSRNLILWVFLVYFFISIFMLGWLLWPFVSTIVLAATVTGVFNPVYCFLAKKLSPLLASLLTCILVFAVLFVPIVSLVGILSTEAYELYGMARSAVLGDHLRSLLQGSEWVERLNRLIAPFQIEITGEQLNGAITEVGRTVGLFLYDQARAITSNILKFILHFFFMLIIIFYLLIDKQRLLDFIFDLSPLPDEQDQKLFQKFKDMAGAILIGNGLSGLIQGVAGGILFAVFGLRSPFMWGVVMTILAFLPILGIGLVFIPATVLLFLNGRIAAGVIFLVFYAVLSGSIEYFVKPKLVGKRVQMHTLLVFLSIIGGLRLFGILGIIYGPLVVTAFLTLTDIYHSGYQQLVESSE
ncbi:MAG: permease [Deltaproteobacteria bacterium SG8_13]|nr:MAG: permease [Deltaproteobacteria bacterium SG8_13]